MRYITIVHRLPERIGIRGFIRVGTIALVNVEGVLVSRPRILARCTPRDIMRTFEDSVLKSHFRILTRRTSRVRSRTLVHFLCVHTCPERSLTSRFAGLVRRPVSKSLHVVVVEIHPSSKRFMPHSSQNDWIQRSYLPLRYGVPISEAYRFRR